LAIELQKIYLPPQAVKFAVPRVRELPVPILDVGAENVPSPSHHSFETEVE
jgi:hypothetical protein